MSNPIILYRDIDFSKNELEAAMKYFHCTDSRMDIQPNQLVIGRYSVLPFYLEQERDIKKAGAKLINSYDQHDYVANLQRWYEDLYKPTDFGQHLTPRTWFSAEEMMKADYGGPFFIKGSTNSRKNLWKTHAYAHDKKAAIQVMLRLQEDTLISQQNIVFREYAPLKKLMNGINGQPITKEFRCFFCYGELLCGAFYWSSYVDDLIDEGIEIPSIHEVPLAFLGEVNARIRDNINFYVVDVAQTEGGEWVVVELNDGCMSGLSENDPELLYFRLKEVIGKWR